MKKKIGLLVGLLVLCAALFAACGMPGYVANPPEDPKELVTKLEKDGWTVQSQDIPGMNMVMGMKSNVDIEKMDELGDDEKISMETVTVIYYASEELAKVSYEAMDAAIKLQKESVPSGVKFSYSTKQKGKAVSMYMKIDGKVGDIKDGDFNPFPDLD